MTWLHDHVHFEQPALHATLTDYVHEVHHAGERITRLEKVIDEAIAKAPEPIRSLVAALQALRVGADDGGDHCGRNRFAEPLSDSSPVDELQRTGLE